MNSIENAASDARRDVPVPPDSGSGSDGKHPSTVLMQLLDTPAVEESLVRRVHGGFGDAHMLNEDARILTLELDFRPCPYDCATCFPSLVKV